MISSAISLLPCFNFAASHSESVALDGSVEFKPQQRQLGFCARNLFA
jgi:hypothetical protein